MSPVREIKSNLIELQSSQFRVLLDEYKKLIEARNLSSKGGYAACVKEFFHWLELSGVNQIKRVTSTLMIAYLEYISTRPKKRSEGTLSDSMVNQHLFSVRMLTEYLLETHQIESAVIIPKNNQGTSKERDSLTQKEIALTYQHCQSKLERAILSCAYGCALRRAEMEVLNINDLNFATGVLVVREGKGNKRRDVPMSDAIIRDLKDYMLYERPQYLKEKNFLELSFFINQKGKRMEGDHMNEIVKTILERTQDVGILNKTITLHCLRHSIAEHLLDNGADIEFIRDFLGHSEIDTSHIYARKNKQKQKRLKR